VSPHLERLRLLANCLENGGAEGLAVELPFLFLTTILALSLLCGLQLGLPVRTVLSCRNLPRLPVLVTPFLGDTDLKEGAATSAQDDHTCLRMRALVLPGCVTPRLRQDWLRIGAIGVDVQRRQRDDRAVLGSFRFGHLRRQLGKGNLRILAMRIELDLLLDKRVQFLERGERTRVELFDVGRA
jgi:hypothetical protein